MFTVDDERRDVLAAYMTKEPRGFGTPCVSSFERKMYVVVDAEVIDEQGAHRSGVHAVWRPHQLEECALVLQRVVGFQAFSKGLDSCLTFRIDSAPQFLTGCFTAAGNQATGSDKDAPGNAFRMRERVAGDRSTADREREAPTLVRLEHEAR